MSSDRPPSAQVSSKAPENAFFNPPPLNSNVSPIGLPKGFWGYALVVVILVVVAIFATLTSRGSKDPPSSEVRPNASAIVVAVSAERIRPLNCGIYKDPDCSKVDYQKFAGWLKSSKASSASEASLDCNKKGKLTLNKVGSLVSSVNLCECICNK